MRNGLLMMIALAAATVAGCGGGGETASSEDVAQGHQLFKGTCATCHGPDGFGVPRLGKDLHDNEFVKAQSDEELLAFLKQGRPASHPDNERGVDMPPKGGNPAITDEELALIVQYMRSLN
jgi:disulfide bond formation protein DsbB